MEHPNEMLQGSQPISAESQERVFGDAPPQPSPQAERELAGGENDEMQQMFSGLIKSFQGVMHGDGAPPQPSPQVERELESGEGLDAELWLSEGTGPDGGDLIILDDELYPVDGGEAEIVDSCATADRRVEQPAGEEDVERVSYWDSGAKSVGEYLRQIRFPEVERVLTDEEVAEQQAKEERSRKYNEWRREWLRPWHPKEMIEYAFHDAQTRGVDVQVDIHNKHVIKALSYYFTEDKRFEDFREVLMDGSVFTQKWSLKKGLLISGVTGSGKTELMWMFRKNKRCSYEVVDAIQLATDYQEKGNDVINPYRKLRKVYPHVDNFNQPALGLCLDDIGTEEPKNHYGNKADVVAEILFSRYSNKIPYHMTHITTNLTGKQLLERYGPRLQSRMIEMFNVIDLTGVDRRLVESR